jgi:hypothetical protein
MQLLKAIATGLRADSAVEIARPGADRDTGRESVDLATDRDKTSQSAFEAADDRLRLNSPAMDVSQTKGE